MAAECEALFEVNYMPQGSSKNSLVGLKIGWNKAYLRRNPENQKICEVCGTQFNKRGKKIRKHCSVKCKAKSQVKEVKLTKDEYNKSYYEKNKEFIIIQNRTYRQCHYSERNKHQNKRRHDDPVYRLSIYLRTRLNKALKGNYRNGSAVRDLGCTIPELVIHLEKQFQEGMFLDNHGEWHIDHKKPLSMFDLTDREQLLQACHYTNLQPMWALDNIKKNNKYEVQKSV